MLNYINNGNVNGKEQINLGDHYFNIKREVVLTPFKTRERTIESAAIQDLTYSETSQRPGSPFGILTNSCKASDNNSSQF